MYYENPHWWAHLWGFSFEIESSLEVYLKRITFDLILKPRLINSSRIELIIKKHLLYVEKDKDKVDESLSQTPGLISQLKK